jgi:tetratricopeptide (TPR) repeat protein/predicted secreted protein
VLPGLPHAGFLLVLVVLAVYLNTFGFEFAYDDFRFVVNNKAIHKLGNAPSFFVAPVSEVCYRPITFLSLALDHAAAGLRPALYHVENVLLHALVTLLLYRLLLPVAAGAAWLAAAVFAVTPLHTEVVANVTSRSELLAALFGLLALGVARSGARKADVLGRAGANPARPNRARPIRARALLPAFLSGGLYLLALMSKESAVAIPALALVMSWPLGRRAADDAGAPRAPDVPPADRLRRYLRFVPLGPLCGMAVALGAYLLLRRHALGQVQWPREAMLDNPLMYSDLSTRLRTALMVLGQNLRLSLVPWPLSADYTFPETPLIVHWSDPRFLGWTALVAGAAAALAAGRRFPNIARGMAWWLAAMLPLSNLFMTFATIRAERLLYLASMGTCLALAEAAVRLRAPESGAPDSGAKLGRRARFGPAWVAALAGLLALLGVQTVRRNMVWKDRGSVILATARDAPRSIRANYQLAEHLVRSGDCAAAAPYYGRVLAIYPAFGMARYNLAACYEKLGRLDAAEPLYRELFAANPGDRGLAQAVTAACEARKDWPCVADALRRFLATSRQGSADASAWLALGNALNRAGRVAEAESAYRRALQWRDDATTRFNLAGTLVNLGRVKEAIEEYRAAQRLGMNSNELYADWAAAERRAHR